MEYQTARVRKLRNGKWQARVSFQDPDGKWHEKTKTLDVTSRRSAMRMAEDLRDELNERERRRSIPALSYGQDSLLISSYMRDYISSLEAGGAIEAATAENYRRCAAHVMRHMPDVPIGEITPSMVLSMQAGLLEDGLCNNTVARAHRFLKQVLAQAVEYGQLDRSPITKSVRPPKRETREPNALDDEGRRKLLALLDDMEDTPMTLAVRLALSAGLRREEACGLRWRDVDLDGRTIRVRQVVTSVAGRCIVKGPKTPSSRRDVPLEPDLESRLRRRLADMEWESGKSARQVLGDLYVIGDARGRYASPDVITKEFRSFARSYGLRGTTGKVVNFHDLRHTFATFLVSHGTDIKTVSALMGHSNAAMTLNVYASAEPNARRSAAEVIARGMSERPEQGRPKLRVAS